MVLLCVAVGLLSCFCMLVRSRAMVGNSRGNRTPNLHITLSTLLHSPPPATVTFDNTGTVTPRPSLFPVCIIVDVCAVSRSRRV